MFQYDLDQCIIQSFTGVKDKNGKEIYEGDIIRGEEFDDGSSLYIRKHPNIITEEVSYDDWFGYDFTRFDRDTIEVVGNIFNEPIKTN